MGTRRAFPQWPTSRPSRIWPTTWPATTLAAGHDGLMFCSSQERIRAAHAELLSAVRGGEIAAARIGASLRRILALKERFLLQRRRGPYAPQTVERSQRLLAALGGGADSGVDPTARG